MWVRSTIPKGELIINLDWTRSSSQLSELCAGKCGRIMPKVCSNSKVSFAKLVVLAMKGFESKKKYQQKFYCHKFLYTVPLNTKNPRLNFRRLVYIEIWGAQALEDEFSSFSRLLALQRFSDSIHVFERVWSALFFAYSKFAYRILLLTNEI